MGAGQITETTEANLVGSGCTTSASNPTGTLGATCLAGIPLATMARVDSAPRRHRQARLPVRAMAERWVLPSPVLCDGANGSSTYTGSACQFATWDNLQLQAVFVDDTAPTMTSLNGPNQAVNGSTASFAAAADPTIQGFECRVANVHDWVPCTSGAKRTPGRRGSTPSRSERSTRVGIAHRFRAGPDGRQGRPGRVDDQRPERDGGHIGHVRVHLQRARNVLRALNAVSTPCTSPKTFTGLAQGTYTFQVMASDGAGNNSGLVTRTWTVDTIAPETSLTEVPPRAPRSRVRVGLVRSHLLRRQLHLRLHPRRCLAALQRDDGV